MPAVRSHALTPHPLQARALVFREIRVMCALGRHENVLALHEVLELVQVRLSHRRLR